jgi:hypothetical protein
MAEGVVLGSLPPGEGEEWTTTEVVANTGIRRGDLRRWARTHGIEPVGAGVDRGRELRWPAVAVWRARADSAGRGNRVSGETRSEAAHRGWVTRRGDPIE